MVCDRAVACGEKDVRIKVSNVAEDGDLTLSPRQPEPDVLVVATLTDGDGIMTEADGVETIGTWRWHWTNGEVAYTVDATTGAVSPTVDDANVIDGATTNSYTPNDADLGRYLYALVRYRDGQAPDDARWLIARTEFAVQQDPGPAPAPGQGNAAPAFDPMEVMFEVPEDTPSTGFVGQHPNGATDAEDDDATLEYDLSGADADSFALVLPDNRGDYYAAQETLQLSLTPVQIAVMPVTHLDYESKTTYSFELGATDSEGARSFATVTVNVTGVNEAPSAPVEFISGLGVTGPSNITVPEVAEGADDSSGELGAYEATRLPRGASSVRWSLAGLDKDDFNISRDGVLTFKSSPNFEDPTDRERDLNDDGDTNDPREEAAQNNRYLIVVEAAAGGEVDKYGVTVTVGNLDEHGMVTLPTERPEVGQAITAELTDPDEAISIVRWEWYKAELSTDVFNLIPGPITDTYTPVAADANWWLRANVFYSDGEGAGKEAKEIAMGGTIQIAPMFDGDAAERSVEENTAAGMNLGDPITAMDEGDTLTYALGGADMRSFDIDPDTGQLMTRAVLDHETKDMYTVTVIATDTAGASDEITVTVTVTNVEELGMVDLSARPVVGTELTASVTDRDNVVDGSVAWQWASSATMDGTFEDISGAMAAAYTPVAEDAGMYLRATASYSDGEGSGKTDDQIAMYPVNMPPMFDAAEATRSVAEGTAAGMNVGDPITAMDEGDTLTYALGGADMRSFAIDDMGQITVGTGTALDYETTTSYTVTVTATDAAGASDEVMVTITVTNVDEEGMVDLDAEQPVVGIALTASVTDPDGDVTGETWQWASSDGMAGTYTNIEGAGAMKAAYTPTMDDEGMYLRATAAYNDGVGDADSAMMATAEAVVSYSSPAFADDAATAIDVAEDTAAGGNIGDPYMATDADGDPPAYALSGADATAFTIDRTGQLMTRAALDYETKMTYMVTVEVRDNEDASGVADTAVDDSIAVTVNVTNVDEGGTVTLPATAPVVGAAITASVTDPDNVVDGSVTWQWASSDAMAGTYTDIEGAMAMDASYTPVDGDVGMYLRATATYDDGVGADSAMMVTANAVVAAATGPTTGSEVGDMYDIDDSGVIDLEEVEQALYDHFFGEGDEAISQEEVEDVLYLHFFPS